MCGGMDSSSVVYWLCNHGWPGKPLEATLSNLKIESESTQEVDYAEPQAQYLLVVST